MSRMQNYNVEKINTTGENFLAGRVWREISCKHPSVQWHFNPNHK